MPTQQPQNDASVYAGGLPVHATLDPSKDGDVSEFSHVRTAPEDYPVQHHGRTTTSTHL
jgi:hypothetical protein